MKLLLALSLLFTSFIVFGFPAPYQSKEIYNLKVKVDNQNSGLSNNSSLSTDGTYAKRYLRLTYNASEAGTAGTTFSASASLPAEAVLTGVYGQVYRQVVSANDNPIGLTCTAPLNSVADTASENLFDLADLTDTTTGSVISVTNSASVQAFKEGCDLYFEIGAGASGVTDGIIIFSIEYFIGD